MRADQPLSRPQDFRGDYAIASPIARPRGLSASLLVAFALIGCQTIRLEVTSDPLGAEIYRGRSGNQLLPTGNFTPFTFTYSDFRPHWMRMEYGAQLNGFEFAHQTLEEQPVGANASIHLVLQPITIDLTVDSDPPGAQILLAYELTGKRVDTGFKTPHVFSYPYTDAHWLMPH